jgi:hypothetical protein
MTSIDPEVQDDPEYTEDDVRELADVLFNEHDAPPQYHVQARWALATGYKKAKHDLTRQLLPPDARERIAEWFRESCLDVDANDDAYDDDDLSRFADQILAALATSPEAAAECPEASE